MNKYLIYKIIALAAISSFHNAQAAIISIKLPGNVASYSTTVGSQFDANIYIDSVPDLGGFDFDLTFDSTRLRAISLTSANVFGVGGTESNTSLTSAGVYHFGETVSGTTPMLTAGLVVNNVTPLLLGTFHFQALKTTPLTQPVVLSIDSSTISLFDLGVTTFYGGSIKTAGVAITPAIAAVPVPPSALLFAPGLLAVFGLRKNKAQYLAA